MSETISKTDPNLILIDDISDFKQHGLKLVEKARRDVYILSNNLDPLLYNHQDFFQALLLFSKNDRRSQTKILVKNIQLIIDRGHQLLQLARKLPSKIEIRKLLIEPENKTHAYLMGDKNCLLYKHDDQKYQGFINYKAAPECQAISEEFIYLWEQHSSLDPSLRSFVL